ncbi:MAG: manganese efflux pump [Clostridia bacterium]|nr:manganese efflux pump [Clostridia bacterium]
MTFIEVFLTGIGLSADAFAVAICKGLNMKKINYKHTLIIALFFGGFQALMPLIGWFLGSQFRVYIESFDHWIAFVLLAFIGGKMIYEVIKGEDECCGCEQEKFNVKEIFVMAVATSIDALAVGITFALVNVNIWGSISVIGLTTFILSAIGVVIGNKFGVKYKSKAELAGGIILVLIGLKILLEHLGIISF